MLLMLLLLACVPLNAKVIDLNHTLSEETLVYQIPFDTSF